MTQRGYKYWILIYMYVHINIYFFIRTSGRQALWQDDSPNSSSEDNSGMCWKCSSPYYGENVFPKQSGFYFQPSHTMIPCPALVQWTKSSLGESRSIMPCRCIRPFSLFSQNIWHTQYKRKKAYLAHNFILFLFLALNSWPRAWQEGARDAKLNSLLGSWF